MHTTTLLFGLAALAGHALAQSCSGNACSSACSMGTFNYAGDGDLAPVTCPAGEGICA
jgi:hypothetical protein